MCSGFVVLVHTPTSGQLYNDRVDFQTWSDITLTYFYTQNYSLGGDVGLRGVLSSKDWSLFYIRPTVHYTFSSSFKLSGGVASFNTINKYFSNSSEI